MLIYKENITSNAILTDESGNPSWSIIVVLKAIKTESFR